MYIFFCYKYLLFYMDRHQNRAKWQKSNKASRGLGLITSPSSSYPCLAWAECPFSYEVSQLSGVLASGKWHVSSLSLFYSLLILNFQHTYANNKWIIYFPCFCSAVGKETRLVRLENVDDLMSYQMIFKKHNIRVCYYKHCNEIITNAYEKRDTFYMCTHIQWEVSLSSCCASNR